MRTSGLVHVKSSHGIIEDSHLIPPGYTFVFNDLVSNTIFLIIYWLYIKIINTRDSNLV